MADRGQELNPADLDLDLDLDFEVETPSAELPELDLDIPQLDLAEEVQASDFFGDGEPAEFVKAWKREGVPTAVRGLGQGLEMLATNMEAPPSVGDVEDFMAPPVAAEAPRGEIGMALGGVAERAAEAVAPGLRETGADLSEWAAKEQAVNEQKFPKDPRLEGVPWTDAITNPDLVGPYIQNALGANAPILVGGVGSALLGGAVAGPAGAVTLGSAFMYLEESGHSYADLKELGVAPEDAAEVASAVGAVNAILEGAGISNLVRIVPGLRSIIGKEVLKNAADKTWRNSLRKGLEQAVVEGSTESLQEMIGNIGKRVFNENQDLLEGMGESAFIGALIGKISGTAGTAPIGARLEQQSQQETPDEKIARLTAEMEANEKAQQERLAELAKQAGAEGVDVEEVVLQTPPGELTDIETPDSEITLSRGQAVEDGDVTALDETEAEPRTELDETLSETPAEARSDEIYIELRQEQERLANELSATLAGYDVQEIPETPEEEDIVLAESEDLTELRDLDVLAEEMLGEEFEPELDTREPPPGVSTKGMELPYGRGFPAEEGEFDVAEKPQAEEADEDTGAEEAPAAEATEERVNETLIQEAERVFAKALGKDDQLALFANVFGRKEDSPMKRAKEAFGKTLAHAAATGSLTQETFEKALAKLSGTTKLQKISGALWKEVEKQASNYRSIPSNWIVPDTEDAVRVYRTLGLDTSAGKLKNPRTVLKKGGEKFVVGPLTPKDWADRVDSRMTPEEIEAAARWYDDIIDAFSVIKSEPLRETVIKAWLMSNQRVSPQGALMNVMRAMNQVRSGAKGKSAGLRNAEVKRLIRTGKIEGLSGLGAKLSDFVDSALGRAVRTFMGNTDMGGDPGVIDVHSARDFGWVDPPHHKRLVEIFGDQAKAVKLDSKKGAPTAQVYEVLSQRMRKQADYLNKIKWHGRSNWTTREVQAIGWTLMVNWSQATVGAYDSYASIDYATTQYNPSPRKSLFDNVKGWDGLSLRRKMTAQQRVMESVSRYLDATMGTITTRVNTGVARAADSQVPGTTVSMMTADELRGEANLAMMYLLKQPISSYVRIFPPKSKVNAATVAIKLPAESSQRLVTKIWNGIKDIEISAKLRKGVDQGPVTIGDAGLGNMSVDGSPVMTFTLTKPAGVASKNLANVVREWLDSSNITLPDGVEVDVVPSEAGAIQHNWEEDPDGKAILQKLSERYPQKWVEALARDGAKFAEEAAERAVAGQPQPAISPVRESIDYVPEVRQQQKLNSEAWEKAKTHKTSTDVSSRVEGIESVYSQRDERGMSRDQVIAELKRHFNPGAIDRMIELGVLHFSEEASRNYGEVHPNRGIIVLFPRELAQDQVRAIFLHEAGAHFGLPAMLGGQYRAIIRRLIQMHNERHPVVRDAVKYVTALLQQNPGMSKAILWDEVLAYAITHERMNKLPTIRRAIARIRSWARKTLGINLDLSLEEIKGMAEYAIHGMPHRMSNKKMRQRMRKNLLVVGYDPTLAGAKYVKPGQRRWSLEGDAPVLGAALPESDYIKELKDKDITLYEKAKKLLKRGLAPGGLLPEAVFNRQIQRDGNLEADELKAKVLVATMERAVKADYGVSWDKLPEPQRKELNAALNGDLDALQELEGKEATREAIAAMRIHVDSMSHEFMGILQQEMREEVGRLQETTGKTIEQLTAEENKQLAKLEAQLGLLKTIQDNVGKYLNRSYRAFDDAAWNSNVSDEVVSEALKYLRDRAHAYAASLEDKARAVLAEAPEGSKRAEKAGRDLALAAKIRESAAKDAQHIVTDILKNGTAYDDVFAYIKESPLGAKDLSILKRRGDIAPEIRALLGEYQDPRINYVRTITKMTRLVFNDRFLRKILEEGKGVYFWEKNDPDRPTKADTPVAAKGDVKMGRLAGYYAPREVAVAMQEAVAKDHYNGFLRHWIKLNGMVKFGKTVLSPTTAFRNFMSASFFAMANGHFNMAQTRHGFKTMKTYFLNRGSEGALEYMMKMKRLGVVYDTAHATEMMRLLEDSHLEDWVLRKNILGVKQAQKIKDFAQAFYTYGDDFWKIMGFEQEKAQLVRSGMSNAEAEIKAAERIRNTYPTYSMTGKWVQALRRFPLVGTFVSFPAEIIRTSYNITWYAAEDLKAGRSELAARRMTGIAFASAAIGLAAEMSRQFFDIDEDEEEAIRYTAPPWQVNSTYFYIGRNDDGSPQYIDLSFLDPYNYWKRPATAIMRDAPWEDSWKSALSDAITPFFGTDITMQAILEAFGASPDGARPVHSPGESWDEYTLKAVKHIGQTIQPGITAWADRMLKAAGVTEEAIEGGGALSRSGKKYRVDHEIAGLFGWRVSEFSPKNAVRYRGIEMAFAKNAAKSMVHSTIRSPNKISDEELEQKYHQGRRHYERAYRKLVRTIKAIEKAGADSSQIRAWMKNNRSIPKADIPYILRGEVPPFEITKAAERETRKAAMALFGPEVAKVQMERHRKIRKIQGK